jgi:hypothetical protein
MKELVMAMWAAADRMRYRPDEYLKRIDDIRSSLYWIGRGAETDVAFQQHKDGSFRREITDDIKKLVRFTEISIDMWKSLDKQGMLGPMKAYGSELRKLEQHYAKTDCKKCGAHAPAHVVGCKNMPESWR